VRLSKIILFKPLLANKLRKTIANHSEPFCQFFIRPKLNLLLKQYGDVVDKNKIICS
jgi:hypothetical protein